MRKIQIRREIFSLQSIQRAVEDYKKIAKTSLKTGKTYYTVTFWKCIHDEDLTVKEFKNYLIGLENS